jgi:hypothetical protein
MQNGPGSLPARLLGHLITSTAAPSSVLLT